MKLIYRITSRVAIMLTVILSLWAVLIYLIVIKEVYDEIDDNLEDYSEMIISKFNAGGTMPEQDNGTNNSYHIELLSDTYIDIQQSTISTDDLIYIAIKGETEPARVLKTIFRADNGKTYRLYVYTPSIEHEDLLEAILYAIVTLFVSLLITIVVINVWVYKTSLSPMYKILQWLKMYKLGAVNSQIDNSTDIVEFKKLNAAIESSIRRIEKNYAEQKVFIGNASHEMQTPLAICQTRLEALLETQLDEMQLQEIIKTQQTIDYMKKLNKALLLLSKIENQQFSEVDHVDFNAIVESLVPDFEEVYAFREITVEVEVKATLVVSMNVTLAKTLIINLIKNAFVHNVDQGKVSVIIDDAKLVIENSGNKALDATQIFNRFYQGKKNPNSTGLGLALVDSICEANNFKVKYEFIEHKHIFSITF